MNFLDKLGKLFVKNMACTIILAFAVVFFLYFAEGDLIAGVLTAVSALVACICIVLLYREYKSMSKAKPVAPAKKPVAKKTTKKSKK